MTMDAGTPPPAPGHAPATFASRVRRVIVAVIIVSFGLAALGGIAALLGAELGDTAWKVLATTATIGGFSIAVLCCAALIGRRAQVFGAIGVAISLVSAVLVLVLIWGDPRADVFFRILATGIILSTACAIASLLLLLADRRRSAVRSGLAVTLALVGIVLLLVLNLVWEVVEPDSEIYPRVLGIVSILAALGIVVLPVMSLLLRDDADTARTHTIDPALAHRLIAEATRRGISVDELVAPLWSPAEPAPRTPTDPA